MSRDFYASGSCWVSGIKLMIMWPAECHYCSHLPHCYGNGTSQLFPSSSIHPLLTAGGGLCFLSLFVFAIPAAAASSMFVQNNLEKYCLGCPVTPGVDGACEMERLGERLRGEENVALVLSLSALCPFLILQHMCSRRWCERSQGESV